MLRLFVSTAAAILAITPALADGRSHEAGKAPQSIEEELAPHGTPYSTSNAFSNAAHNATENQQGASITHNAATQTGILDLSQ